MNHPQIRGSQMHSGLPVIYGAIGRVQSATAILAEIPRQMDAASAAGDLTVSDVKREQIKRLAFELAAKAIEITSALADMAAV